MKRRVRMSVERLRDTARTLDAAAQALRAQDEARREAARAATPAGYERVAPEVMRMRDRRYIDHLVRVTGEHASDPALCGFTPHHAYWGCVIGGEPCAECWRRAALAPVSAIATPSPTTLEEEASAFCAVEGA